VAPEITHRGRGPGWRGRYPADVLIIALILFGMLVGALAQLVVGQQGSGIDWPMAFAAGLIGSFVGGLLISLLAGDGLELEASGLLGSLAGAILVTIGWQWWRRRSAAQ
jgi:uncharacterized membrane protein YeaQ/YmgE (transglycosylase-associated protein family)